MLRAVKSLQTEDVVMTRSHRSKNEDLGELSPFITVQADGSWRLFAPDVPDFNGVLRHAPGLKGYFFSREAEEACIKFNREWAAGKHPHPRFLFAYITLSTACNLRCKGCYQGLDRRHRGVVPWKQSWLAGRLDEILDYLISRGGSSVAYPGIGELMTDPDAFEFIERVRARGLDFVLFTNGQALIDPTVVERLDDFGVTVILSFRDTEEHEHDKRTNRTGSFKKSVTALANCLKGRFRSEERLAIEMPVIQTNKDRAFDLLPVTRALGVVPMIEMYVVVGLPPEGVKESLTFKQTDEFFEQLSALDRRFGFDTKTEWGQRIIGRPPCRRPNFTFTVGHDKQIMGCPASPCVLGNIEGTTVDKAIETTEARKNLAGDKICPCSTFVSYNNQPMLTLNNPLNKLNGEICHVR